MRYLSVGETQRCTGAPAVSMDRNGGVVTHRYDLLIGPRSGPIRFALTLSISRTVPADQLLNFRFKIQDDEFGKDDLAAWACIRLDRLRDGYRFVRLLDANGDRSRGILLVKITKSLS